MGPAGFEPAKPKRQIYSLLVLTTHPRPHINCAKGRIRTLANGFGDHHATVTSPTRICFVLRERLELSHLAAIDPKSTVTTNSTIQAFYYVKDPIAYLLLYNMKTIYNFQPLYKLFCSTRKIRTSIVWFVARYSIH